MSKTIIYGVNKVINVGRDNEQQGLFYDCFFAKQEDCIEKIKAYINCMFPNRLHYTEDVIDGKVCILFRDRDTKTDLRFEVLPLEVHL